MRHAAKTDGNHSQFADAFKQCLIPYKDTHGFPGMLDYLVETRTGRLVFLEVKTGPNEPLTEREQQMFTLFPANCYKVWEPEQALAIARDE